MPPTAGGTSRWIGCPPTRSSEPFGAGGSFSASRLSRSVPLDEVAAVKDLVKLWEPLLVRMLVIATSGRFTGDAVQYAEQHDQKSLLARIEMRPESHLATHLAARPDLDAEFALR